MSVLNVMHVVRLRLRVYWLCSSPAEVCLNFSLFFFLHFQGLNKRPSVANLLRLRMGGVCVPGTRESERIAASRSTSSAARQHNCRSQGAEKQRVHFFLSCINVSDVQFFLSDFIRYPIILYIDIISVNSIN